MRVSVRCVSVRTCGINVVSVVCVVCACVCYLRAGRPVAQEFGDTHRRHIARIFNTPFAFRVLECA